MRSVSYSMGVSLDGYIVGPEGDITAPPPDEEVWRLVTDEIREVGVHLMGRRLYETMLYWETADQDPSLDDSEIEWSALWKPLPKVVFSTTLSAVEGTARLASGGLAEEIERLRAEPGEGDIAIGGATLAAEAAALDLIDEYRAMVYPVLVGRRHSVLSPARAPGGSRTRRDPHLQLERRLPPLPRGALAAASAFTSRTLGARSSELVEGAPDGRHVVGIGASSRAVKSLAGLPREGRVIAAGEAWVWGPLQTEH